MSALRMTDDSNNIKVMIPRSLTEMTLKYFHEGLGHPGVRRMEYSIRTKYHWKDLAIDTEKHCNNCRLCKLRKQTYGEGKIPTYRYDINTRPMQRVHIDLIGPLPRTSRGSEYILVAKCAFSQWIETATLRTKSAQEVTKAITDKIPLTHGSIEHIITDNGKEFTANIAGAVYELTNTKHTTTTPYNPQANGKVENQNKTLKDMLAIYCNAQQRDWDTYLGVITHYYRTTVCPTTGYSPFRLVFGREARQPSEEWIKDFANKNQVNIDEYVTNLTKALLYTWRKVEIKIRSNQDGVDNPNRTTVKRERLFTPYEVGDKFYLKTIPKRFYNDKGKEKFKLAAKLQMRYTGPHIVTTVHNPIIYTALVNGRNKIIHGNKMKRDISTKDIQPEDFAGYGDINEESEDDEENNQEINLNLSHPDDEYETSDSEEELERFLKGETNNVPIISG